MPKTHRSLILVLALPLTACVTAKNPGNQNTTGSSTAPSTQSTQSRPSGGSGASTGTTTGTGGALTWTPCSLDDQPGFECSTLEVPLNHDDPAGKKITLALSRKKHSDSDYRGVVLSNPGGPGLPGRNLASFADSLPQGIGKKYDWIGIDPRGTGESKPRLDCIGDTKATRALPYVPKDQAQLDIWKADAKRIAQNCAKAPGKELLPFLRTTDSVKDLEAVRKALGVEKVTYWGASYGSYLGMMYATLYPERIEKMALDGVVSPLKSWYESNLTQQKALEKSLNKYFEWVAANHAQYQLGDNAAAVRKRVQDKFAQLRAAAPATDGKRSMDQVLSEALQSASYGVGFWGPVAMALKMYLVDNNSTILEALGEGTDSKTRSVYLAVNCSEVDWPDWNKTTSDAKASHEHSSTFSWLNTWFNAPCVDWPIPVKAQPQIRADKVKFPILLLGETFDGATPFSGALDARRLFPTSVLVEGLNGITHGGTLAAGACTQKVLFDFFASGKLPPRGSADAADKQCEPVKPS